MFKNLICGLCTVALFSGCDVSAMNVAHLDGNRHEVCNNIYNNLHTFFYDEDPYKAVESIASALVDISRYCPSYEQNFCTMVYSLTVGEHGYFVDYDSDNGMKSVNVHIDENQYRECLDAACALKSNFHIGDFWVRPSLQRNCTYNYCIIVKDGPF